MKPHNRLSSKLHTFCINNYSAASFKGRTTIPRLQKKKENSVFVSNMTEAFFLDILIWPKSCRVAAKKTTMSYRIMLFPATVYLCIINHRLKTLPIMSITM